MGRQAAVRNLEVDTPAQQPRQIRPLPIPPWLMLLEAALCGISAGLFRIIEAVIAIASLKPWNKGKALGYWLIYRLCGLILGGVINLGLKTDNNQAERVSYAVSTTIQAAGIEER
nr:duf895 domain membrane protein [Colletotrichum truncatum]KAF6782427.1 duf895 domain membrane protein [Colletotrichum truncatum]